MFTFIVIALILFGLLLLGLEVFLIPGTTVVGIIGFIFSLFGVWMSYAEFGAAVGHVTLAATVLLSFLMIYIGFKSGVWTRFANNDYLIQLSDVALQPGTSGKSISVLRPAGKALFDGDDRQYEVHSMGEWIDAGTSIKIVKIEKNKIIVTKV